ncbi:MAG: Rpn family recombination-promoting nuclease/putative transposase [Thermoguttaceae bacterium]
MLVRRKPYKQVAVAPASVRPDSAKSGNIFDAFARNMFARVVLFADFLKNYANPKFVSQIDLAGIMPAPTNLFGKEGTERIVDLVFRCPLKHGSGSLLAVILFEHQTGSLRKIPQKLLKYISAIWETESKAKKPLSAPYFIVLRTGKKPHRKPYPSLADLLPKDANGESIGTVPVVVYDVVDLPTLDFDELIGKPELRLVVGLLKKMTEGLEDEFIEALLPIREFKTINEQMAWFKEAIPFVAKVFAAHNRKWETEKAEVAVQTVIDKGDKNMMLTVFEEAELRGVARGQALGEARGEARGKIDILLAVIRARFKRVPRKLETRFAQ